MVFFEQLICHEAAVTYQVWVLLVLFISKTYSALLSYLFGWNWMAVQLIVYVHYNTSSYSFFVVKQMKNNFSFRYSCSNHFWSLPSDSFLLTTLETCYLLDLTQSLMMSSSTVWSPIALNIALLRVLVTPALFTLWSWAALVLIVPLEYQLCPRGYLLFIPIQKAV